MKIFFGLAGVVVVVGLLAGAGIWWKGQSTPATFQTPVRTQLISRGDLVEVVQAPAEIQPRNKVSIMARVAARIVELPLREGEKVKAGDVLVKLDSSDLEANLRSTQARYAAQQANLGVDASRIAAQKSQLNGLRAALSEAEKDLERQKGLLASHDVSQSLVDTAERRVTETTSSLESAQHSLRAEEGNLQVLRHNLEAAEAEIARAKEDLSYTTITSPIDGVVTILNAKVGELVVTGTMNNAGTVIMEVADLSRMIAQARVDETDVANVEVDQPVKVRLLAYPDEVFDGKVTAVALVRTTERGQSVGSSGDSKTFKVEIMIDTKGRRIHSGLTADVEIQSHRNENVIRVPTQAVLGRPTDSLPQAVVENNPNVDTGKTVALIVLRMVDGKALITPVIVGASDNTHTMIKSGLSDGDKVMIGPYKTLDTLMHEQLVTEDVPTSATTKPTTQTAPASDGFRS